MFNCRWILSASSMSLLICASAWGQQIGATQQVQTGQVTQTPPGQTPLGQPNAQGNVTVPLMTMEQAMQEGLAQSERQPFPPLTAAEQSYLDQVLKVWEQRTDQIERYQCNFRRFERDPAAFSAGYYKISTGVIKFMSPDKGLFDVQVVKTIKDKVNQQYEVDPKNPHGGEFWICDGRWVYIRDRATQVEKQIELPPSMRGNQIYLSPLPFLFGVKADEIKNRYWIRPVPVKGEGNALEAWPKFVDDKANYSRVTVVLDPKDILPKSLIVYLPNWTPESQKIQIFEFNDRVTKSPGLFGKLFEGQFIPTKLPSDWTIDREPYIDPNLQRENVATPPQMQNQVPIR